MCNKRVTLLLSHFHRTIEEQIQRLTLDSKENTDSIHSSAEADSGASALSSNSSSKSSSSSTASSSSYNLSNQSTEPQSSGQPVDNTILNNLNEVGLKTKSQSRDGIAAIGVITTASTNNIPLNISEPIYAVVNLKNKYARREKMKEEMKNPKNPIRERPNSFHVASSDYEEVKI